METILSTAGRQKVYAIDETAEIAGVRRGSAELAKLQSFDETVAGKLAIAVTEAATNIVKHATRGQIILRPVEQGDATGIEVIALDAGRGMSNVALHMRDGVSTAGSYGVGLGAMVRLADEFDIYSHEDKGTAIYMKFWNIPPTPASGIWQTGVVCLPLPSEEVCGDAWAVCSDPTLATVMVADGLGHGPDAARASEAAINLIGSHPDLYPEAAIWESHASLRATRGAAVAVARLDTLSEELHFSGVGNIAAVCFQTGSKRQLMSHNGIVGSNMRKVQEFVLPWTSGTMLVMHSDGLGTRWSLDQYPGLEAAHPALIAAVLYRDFCRQRDDVTVLVIREQVIQ
jgi:anti-sigma regulatory factor (Ser/Thr protein kinase)